MKNLLTLIGASIKDTLEIDRGINYFLDYLTINENRELGVFRGGEYDNSQIAKTLEKEPLYLKFSTSYLINPKKQAVFQDSLGQIFIGNKYFPKRNKVLILEIPDLFTNSLDCLPQLIVKREALNAIDIIAKNRKEIKKND